MTNEYNPSILALQETMFDNAKYLDKLNGSKYEWHLKPGPVKIRNGVALAIDKNIPHNEITLKTDLQAIACRTIGNKGITYVSVYIPPRKTKPKDLKVKMQKLIDQIPKPFLIMGDFNAHNKEWGSYKNDRWGDAIKDIIKTNNLKIMNNGSSTKTSIAYACLSAVDLTLASEDFKSNLEWSTDIDNRGSDHFPILLNDPHKEKNRTTKKNWILKKADWNLFQSLLINKLPTEREFDMEDITKAILEAANDSIPKTRGIKFTKKVPWWNDDVAKYVNKRRKALRKLKSYKNNDSNKRML